MNRLILRDLIVYLPARLGPALVAILAIPLLTRTLSQQEYGHYLLALTALSLIGALCLSWLVSVVVRFHAVYGAAPLRRILRFSLIGAMVAGAFGWLGISLVLGQSLNRPLYLVAGVLWIVTYAWFEYLAVWARVSEKPVLYGLALCWRSGGGLALALVLFMLGYVRGEVVLIAASLAALMAIPFLTVFNPSTGSLATSSQVAISTRSLFAYGFPAALSNLGVVALSLAPRFVIENIMGVQSVAIYGASYDLAEKTIFFINSMLLLSSSIMAVSIFEERGELAASEFLSRLMRIYLLIASPVAVVLAALSPELVSALLPAEYGEGVVLLPIIAFSGLLVGIMHRYSLVLSFHKATHLIMWSSLAAVAVNIGGCFFLVPRWGLLGAGWAAAIAYFSWLLLVRLAASRYTVPRFPWVSLARIATAGISGALVIRLLAGPGVMVPIAAVSGFIAFGLTLLLVRELPKDEIRSLFSFFITRG